METVAVLLTYPMPNLCESLGPRVHRLLIFLLSFFSVPSRRTVDIDFLTYIDITGVSIRTVANYVLAISQIQKTTDTGESIPMFFILPAQL